jgi:hypothetical protein
LHTSYNALERGLHRLALDPSSKAAPLWPPSSRHNISLLDRQKHLSIQREKYRREVQVWNAAHPNATRWEFRNALPTAVRWLNQYDREWLMDNEPAAIQAKGVPQDKQQHLDWNSYDLELAERVPFESRKLLNAPGKPRRVTKTEIVRALGFPNGLGTSGNKLPITNAALSKYSESLQHCATRRMWWFIEEANQTGKRWGLAELLHWSGFRQEWYDETEVKAAIESAKRAIGEAA